MHALAEEAAGAKLAQGFTMGFWEGFLIPVDFSEEPDMVDSRQAPTKPCRRAGGRSKIMVSLS